jgi:UDP-N-acetylmuramyl pentapeptide phosphotransferase/UDP-N-acetylglucosamine-1-phosphate transferase
MSVLVHLLIGVAFGAVGWLVLQPMFAAPVFTRQNYRGVALPTAVGLVIVLAVVVVTAAGALGEAAGWSGDAAAGPSRDLLWRAAVGFGLLGLLDDLAGGRSGGGFRGHLQALRQGRITTGFVKLAGGALVAVAVVAPVSPSSFGWLVVDAAVVALAANAANLFDRAPGRTIKVSLLAFALLVAVDGASAVLSGPALAVGAGAALLVPDLRERCMLGDTGANVLGASVGLGAVLVLGHGALIAVLFGLVALNLASEMVSFSAVIDRTAPLRWLDRLGRAEMK